MITSDYKGLKLPQLAMGTMRLPVFDGDDTRIDAEQTREMVAYAMEHGANYFDTAWGYHGGNSELVMGEALAAYPRESFYLADKFPGYDSSTWNKVEEIFEEQLRKCRVEYFDFYLVHNVCEMNIDAYLDDEKYGIYSYLLEQKRNGRIRHLGFSVHGNFETFMRFLDAYGDSMEFCQIELNWFDWSLQDAKAKVEECNRRNLPIWVMEPLRGGKLAQLTDEEMASLQALRPDVSAVEWSMRYLQSVPGVATVLTGASNFEQFKENVGIFETSEPLNDAEMAALYAIAAEQTKDAVPCTACRYCTSHCPQELDIPHLIALYNNMMAGGSGKNFIAPMALGALPEDKRPEACIACGSCEAVCPQQLSIAATMEDFAARMK